MKARLAYPRLSNVELMRAMHNAQERGQRAYEMGASALFKHYQRRVTAMSAELDFRNLR